VLGALGVVVEVADDDEPAARTGESDVEEPPRALIESGREQVHLPMWLVVDEVQDDDVGF
jgi:hypothetical protein